MPIGPRTSSAGINAPRRETVTVSPVLGMWSVDAGENIPFGASPDMVNCTIVQGKLRKRPGYTQFPAAHASIGGPVLGLYSTQDQEGNTTLVAAWQDGLAIWNGTAWVAATGGPLTGTDDQLFSFETSEDCIVFCQGVDQVQSLPLGTTAFADLDANCPPAYYLLRFGNRLTIALTVEGGQTFGQRHRRSVENDHTDWTGVGSGFRDAVDLVPQIRGMAKILAKIVLYHSNAIELVTLQPNGAAPFRYDLLTEGTGLYAPKSLNKQGDVHRFLGNDDYYELNGGQLTPIGGQLQEYLISTVNPSRLDQVFSALRTDTKEYLNFVCSVVSDYPDTVHVYNYQRRVWYPWSVPGTPRCATAHRLDDTVTIDGLVGTIDEQNWIFDSRVLTEAYPALLTGHDDGKIYKWDFAYLSDAGSAINCRWTSGDFTSENVFQTPGKKLSLEMITIHYEDIGADFDLNFYISVDGGATWEGPYLLSVTAGSGGVLTANIDVRRSDNRIRFKFEQNSATQAFSIVKFVPTFELSMQEEY